MSKPETIKIDEVEYVRADKVEVRPTKKHIVVLQRGWVVIGDVEKTETEVTLGSYTWNNASVDEKILNNHNAFPSEETGKRAAELQRVSNAIIRACVLVDPDFKPDWGDTDAIKFCPDWSEEEGWGYDMCWEFNRSPAHVSTREKAKEVIELLTKWGVKP
jgi:hypothetical protein